jgi:hypothetical protein
MATPPLSDLHDHVGLASGIIAALVGAWFAITGRSRERIAGIAREAVRDSDEYMPRAVQDEINRELRSDVREIRDRVAEIHTYLIGHGTRQGEDGVVPHRGRRHDDRQDE